MTLTCEVINNAPGLDQIIVYWHDVDPSMGHVTVTCYGQAWTAYFGAMGERVQEMYS